MPVATGGGSKPKPPKPPKKPKPTTTLPATDTSVGGNTNAGKKPKPTTTLPATDTSVGGNTGISKAAKEAAQHRKSEAKHAARRRIESRRESVRAGARTKVTSEEQALGVQARMDSKRAAVRSGQRTKYRAGNLGQAKADVRDTSGAGSRSVVGGKAVSRSRPRDGGGIGGSRFSPQPRQRTGGGITRTGGFDPSRPRTPESGSRPPTNVGGGTRVGGGFGKGDLGRPAPAFFDGSGGGGGGGGAGSNPLNAGTTSADIRKMDMEDVLHGGKRKGRVRHTRGTE